MVANKLFANSQLNIIHFLFHKQTNTFQEIQTASYYTSNTNYANSERLKHDQKIILSLNECRFPIMKKKSNVCNDWKLWFFYWAWICEFKVHGSWRSPDLLNGNQYSIVYNFVSTYALYWTNIIWINLKKETSIIFHF